MQHLLGWYISIGQTADTDVTPIADPVMTIQNGHFLPQQIMNLYWAAAMSATLSRAKFATPKTRVMTNPYIRPIIEAAKPPTNPAVMTLWDRPFAFNALEEIQLLATSALAMGNESCYGIALVGGPLTPAPAGDYYRLRFTSTTTLTAHVWSQLTGPTFQDTLPQGTYAVVNLEVFSATAVAARIIFNGQQYRPGSLAINALSNQQSPWISRRQGGIMGQFTQTALPLIEVLADAADTSQEGYLTIVRVG